jgi:hypothetical protein
LFFATTTITVTAAFIITVTVITGFIIFDLHYQNEHRDRNQSDAAVVSVCRINNNNNRMKDRH